MNSPTPPSQAVRSLVLHAQYLRDLSFESPQAPRGLQEARRAQPQVEMHLDLRAHPLDARDEGGKALNEKVWELVLRLRLSASLEGSSGEGSESGATTEGAQPAPLFIVELEYGGVFAPPAGTDDEVARKAVLTEGAHLLFPYVRKILADVTQEGGFQPVLLNPIDFQGLYLARLKAEEEVAQQEAEKAQKNSPPPSARNGTGVH